MVISSAEAIAMDFPLQDPRFVNRVIINTISNTAERELLTVLSTYTGRAVSFVPRNSDTFNPFKHTEWSSFSSAIVRKHSCKQQFGEEKVYLAHTSRLQSSTERSDPCRKHNSLAFLYRGQMWAVITKARGKQATF